MSRKELLTGYQLKDNQSLAADFQTAATTVKNIDNVGVNISTTGVTTNTGTFNVQHRVVQTVNPGTGAALAFSDWATLTLSPPATLANADTVILINLNQLPPGEIRVTFTAGLSTPNGTADIWVCGCSVGA